MHPSVYLLFESLSLIVSECVVLLNPIAVIVSVVLIRVGGGPVAFRRKCKTDFKKKALDPLLFERCDRFAAHGLVPAFGRNKSMEQVKGTKK